MRLLKKQPGRSAVPFWFFMMPSLAVGGVFTGLLAPVVRESWAATTQTTASQKAAVSSHPLRGTQGTIQTKDAPKMTARGSFRGAKYEPKAGTYLGTALDVSQLTPNAPMREQLITLMRDWGHDSGRDQALYLSFVQFPYEDGSFPTWDSDPRGWLTSADFSNAALAVGATPIITLEPFSHPEQFCRDWKPGKPAFDATKSYAQALGKWGKPVFIRFAHEMNGSWYPWAEWIDKNKNMQRDPGEETGFTAVDYREAYRNVAIMFRKFAPNAALIWCPNSGLLGGARRDVFSPFYPGDDIVDWVGLDVYERGWTLPMPGAKPWAGQFAYNLTHDMADDPNTEANESVNFYETFAAQKNKPFMICETSATLSFRSDLDPDQRATLNNQWKAGYWNQHEYGWIRSVYGTTQSGENLLEPIDKVFPLLKAIVWFQVAKREYIPAERTTNGKREIVWFNNEWTDYRVGGGAVENGSRPYEQQELQLFKRLTSSPHFLSKVVK